MHDIKYVRNNFDDFVKNIKKRNQDYDFSKILELDKIKLEIISKVEKLKEERNKTSKEIGSLYKQNKNSQAEILKEKMKNVSDEIKNLDLELSKIENEIDNLLLNIPNLLDNSVPEGKDEKDNIEIKRWGQIPEFDFTPLSHDDIAQKIGILDLEISAKISGARFYYLSQKGAQLERALINFFLDINIKENGYIETFTPFLVNEKTLRGTGQLPRFKDDLFKIENHNLYLIPTAEVTLTNIFAETILDENKLPLSLTAYTPCFRSEAGSYGKDTKGLIRLHQFNKVELVKLTTPETSAIEHEKLLADAEKLLQLLNLPYRIVLLSSGDTGFSASKCYDIEVWLPSQNRYREISSVSNCKDFQARRANIRYRKKSDNKLHYVHTLNGSGLAVGRTWVAIIENYQQKDGSILIPEILRPYTGFDKIEKNNL